MSNIGKTLFRSSTVRLLTLFVEMVIGFFLMPIIVRELGNRHYGIWVLVGTFLGFYGLFDFGISTAVGRYLSRALGREDENDFNAFFATGFYLFSGIGIIVLVSALILASLSGYVIEDPADKNLFRWLAVILGSSVAVGFPSRAFRAVLASHLRYDLTNAVRMIVALMRLPLVLLVFYMGYGLLALAVVIAGLEVVSMVGIIILAFRVSPRLTVSPQKIDIRRAKLLGVYGFYTILAQIAMLLREQMSPLIITIFQTLSMVTPFAIANRLSRYVKDFMRALVSGLDPLFSRQEGRGDQEKMRFTYLLICRISMYGSVLLGGLLILLGKAFIERWMGPQYTHVVPIMIVLTIGTVVDSAQIPTVGYLYGISRNRFYAVASIANSVLCLVLSIVLIGPFGLLGVALGVTIPKILFDFFIQPIYACRTLEIGMTEFLIKHVVFNLAIPLVFLAGVYVVSASFIAPSYLSVFAIGSFSCIAFIPYVILIGFNNKQRETILRSIPLLQVFYPKTRSVQCADV